MMKNPNAGSHVLNYQLEDRYGVGSSIKVDQHIVNIQLGDVTFAEGGATSCCVVCTEPSEWLTVGRCGHRVVCSKCMIRIRYVDGDKSCCVCRTHCPTVLVTRADGTRGSAAVSSFREYWYHMKTAAYFDDERQYQAAREACKKKLSFYQPLPVFIFVLFGFASSIIIGAVLGSSFHTKHKGLKVLAYALSIFVCASVANFLGWLLFQIYRESELASDDEEDEFRLARAEKPLEQHLHVARLEMKNHENRTNI